MFKLTTRGNIPHAMDEDETMCMSLGGGVVFCGYLCSGSGWKATESAVSRDGDGKYNPKLFKRKKK